MSAFKPQTGITWPLDASGRASSTPVNKSIWTMALTAFKSSNNATALISKIEAEKNWRANYMKYVNDFVVLQAGASEEECLESCRLGLEKLNSAMTWSVNGEVKSSAKEAMSSSALEKFVTKTIVNSGSKADKFTLKAPLGYDLESLSGESLKAQGEAWATYGCIEPSASAALSSIASEEGVSKLVSNKIFVLLGATSSLGPFKSLSKLGASIACVARKGKKMEKLIKDSEESGATLLLPTREGVAGADLLADAPALAEWILSLPKGDEQIVLGCYAYLDGEKHVRASVAMDLIAEKVCLQRKGSALAYLVSPATSHAATEEAVLDVSTRYMNTPAWHGVFRAGFGTFSKNTFYNADKTNIKIFNGLSNFQGPNYALAKTSQQWRAMLAKAEGAVVSANHAPAARTESMVGYATIAAALEGMQSFPPLVAFDPDTASDMMAAILLWDLTSSTSAALPSNKDTHPTLLLVQNACHGGMWRCAYDMETVNTPSFLFGRFTPSYTPSGSLAK